MFKVIFTEDADADIAAIADYVKADNPIAAAGTPCPAVPIALPPSTISSFGTPSQTQEASLQADPW